jgi:adenylate cyclase
LAAAAGRIEQGEFEITLESKTHDEVGFLTQSFVSMGRGLAERERLKDTFGKFINKEIAERALKGELTLGGESKTVTIFFSDIRAFTAISEKLEPQEVVEFLNEYMTRMVDCVEKTDGVVDKFIGDAVMAVWGAPVSAGSLAKDALNCVRAALMMRIALREFNKDRGGEKKPVIRIGCGINTGEVIAGQIGSSHRMEYTVIGDAVNLASRTEALNKPFGTDILITENTYSLIKDYIIAEEMPPVTVKGKEKPVRIFGVVNLKSKDKEQPRPTSLAEVRHILGIEAPDLTKVDTSSSEKKYKIGTE